MLAGLQPVDMPAFRICSTTFEWDAGKAAGNVLKHDVTFAEAAAAFLDAGAVDGPDLMHSSSESRRRRLARSAQGRMLMVVYTKRSGPDGESIRIISARRASRRERTAYETTD